jgi:hypothetical protein
MERITLQYQPLTNKAKQIITGGQRRHGQVCDVWPHGARPGVPGLVELSRDLPHLRMSIYANLENGAEKTLADAL